MHPFLTFELSISEGGYVRSIGTLFAEKLGFDGILSALERLNEGDFVYNNEKVLNPLDYLEIKDNDYLGEKEDIELGRKLNKNNFKREENGIYKLVVEKYLAIIEINDDEVKYLLNKVKLC